MIPVDEAKATLEDLELGTFLGISIQPLLY